MLLRLLALVSLLPSCATLVAAGPDMVPVNSTPQGATIYLNGAAVGKTPMLLPIKRTNAAWSVVRLEATGLEARDVGIKRVVNGWFFGNILFGGLVGIVVDLAAGNVMKVRSAEVIDEDLTRPTTRPAAPEWATRPASRPVDG